MEIKINVPLIDKHGDVIEIKTDNSKVKNVLNEMIDRTRLQQTLWDTARQWRRKEMILMK